MQSFATKIENNIKEAHIKGVQNTQKRKKRK